MGQREANKKPQVVVDVPSIFKVIDSLCSQNSAAVDAFDRGPFA